MNARILGAFLTAGNYEYLRLGARLQSGGTLDFVAQGKVKTMVEKYLFVEAPKAYQRVADGRARFRAVLTM